jgi:hypothetical protein
MALALDDGEAPGPSRRNALGRDPLDRGERRRLRGKAREQGVDRRRVALCLEQHPALVVQD